MLQALSLASLSSLLHTLACTVCIGISFLLFTTCIAWFCIKEITLRRWFSLSPYCMFPYNLSDWTRMRVCVCIVTVHSTLAINWHPHPHQHARVNFWRLQKISNASLASLLYHYSIRNTLLMKRNILNVYLYDRCT